MTTQIQDKDYWRQYSSIEYVNIQMFINTSNGDWSVFVHDRYVCEGSEDNIPPMYQELYDEFHSDK